jgi:predicted DNA-binding protein
MLRRPPYVPHRDLLTETVRVGVPIETKEALERAARRAGKSVSGFAREAVEDAIARTGRPKPR